MRDPARRPAPAVDRLARRHLLRGGLATGALGLLGACGAGGLPGTQAGAGATAAALLLPLTGEAEAIGQAMARAAALALTGRAPETAPQVRDTGDGADSAAEAARQAVAAGARVMFGPLRAEQTPAVLEAAGNVPVVTFSNDDRLAAQGAYVMGLTPAQSVATMFSYARSQGLSRVAVLARDGPVGEATLRAAQAVAAAGGLMLAGGLLRDPAAGGTLGALRDAGGGVLPEAVLLPDGGATLAGFARALRGAGVQLMGSTQWAVADVTGLGDLDGAWFAAPPPDLFLPFADRYEAATGARPGIVAALGHDAALVAAGLGDARGLNRRGLQRAAGFTGALGAFRFQPDGRCLRDLAVLTVTGGQLEVLAEVAGT
jgi:ABC-type branched-subunit amino acid transport system substrate-binding protein